MTEYTLRPPGPQEFDAWYRLYYPYSVLMEDEVTPQISRTIWDWIQDARHPVEAVAAYAGDEMVGFTHYRPFYRTLHGNEACFLDDLFVVEAHRGSGLARALIEAVSKIALERGWSHVRWVAHENNSRARALYDKLAAPLPLVTYKRN
ncbi:MAG: GNAT family N-acetyltransferase [Vulcanimicrobiaceae bacterium]